MHKKKIITLIISIIILLIISFLLYFFVFKDENNNQLTEKANDGLILIKGGTFKMGSSEDESQRENDELQHEVIIDDFYISPYEVTGEEYEEIMGENPSTFKGQNLPVENVSWYEAIEYCNKLSEKEGLTPVYQIEGDKVSWDLSANGYRLPTEAEWEYAARAGTTTPFNTETSISDEEANYYGHYPYGIEENYFSQDSLETKPGEYRQTTIEVGSFSPNKWGLYDMHGNVREWVYDYYGEYDVENNDNPTGPDTGSLKVNRGGRWNDYAKHLRSAFRSSLPPEQSSSNLGFRIARDINPTDTVVSSTEKHLAEDIDTSRILVVYFSWSGNTENAAQIIGEKTGARVEELVLQNPYSNDYNEVLDEAQEDLNSDARPELRTKIYNMEDYDVILIGYPNWWATIPMPIATFLESYDFSNKIIIPFCSHGGGGFGQSIADISKLAPNSQIGEGLSIHYSGGTKLEDDIDTWLTKNRIGND